jgi:hypothetical protein
MQIINHKTEGVVAVGCSALLARILRNPFQRVFKNHRHLLTLLVVFLHPYWQISGRAAGSGQLQIGMLETAISIPMLDKTAPLQKSDVLNNLDARFSDDWNCLIVGLDEIHPIHSIEAEWNRANEISELAASAVGFPVLGETVIEIGKQVAGQETKAKPDQDRSPVLEYLDHILFIFFCILGGIVGYRLGWLHAEWRSMRANVQELSHAAGDIRQPETRSENCQA